jgi:hypothetical protein
MRHKVTVAQGGAATPEDVWRARLNLSGAAPAARR